jgi:hypothetical protein
MPFPFQNHPARLDAVAAGIGRFDTGQPCAKGHSSPRYCSTGQCVQCAGGPLQPREPKAKKPRKRTYAENRRRAELEAGRRHEMSGGAKRLRFWSFGPAMQTEEALARGRYLDQKIKAGANFVRKATGLE